MDVAHAPRGSAGQGQKSFNSDPWRSSKQKTVYLVAAMMRDPTRGSKDSQDHVHIKGCFKEYIELFPSGRTAIAMKEEQYAGKTPQHTAITQQTISYQ